MTRIHVSLQTADLAATTAFYAALFGAGPDKTRADYARFQPEGAPITLSLMPGVPTPVADHFGLKHDSAESFKNARARLESTGHVLRAEENSSCCYAVQDKVWLADPDGRMWEVYTVSDDGGAALVSEDSSCCVTDEPTTTGCCG